MFLIMYVGNIRPYKNDFSNKLEMLNEAEPSKISCSVADKTVSVNIGHRNGTLSFWKYMPKVKSFSSSKESSDKLFGSRIEQFEKRIGNLASTDLVGGNISNLFAGFRH